MTGDAIRAACIHLSLASCLFALVGCGRMSEPSDKTARVPRGVVDDAGPSGDSPHRLVTRTMTRLELRGTVRAPPLDIAPRNATPADRKVFRRVIPMLLGATSRAALVEANRAVHAIHMRIELWTIVGEDYAVLLDVPGAPRGSGLYAFRIATRHAGQPTIVLQVPHAYHDVGTAVIARKLFFASAPRQRFRALFINTMHRYQQRPGVRGPRVVNPADVAHNPDHMFTAATRALDQGAGPLRVIQLHGFAAQSARGIGAIVSTAGPRSPAVTTRYAAALTSVIDEPVRRYPEDIGSLGGTQSAQRAALAGSKTAEFVHLELSPTSRRSLRKTRVAIDAFARAVLIDAASAVPTPTRKGDQPR